MDPELYDLWEKAAAEIDRARQNSGAIANRKLTEQIEAIRAGKSHALVMKLGPDLSAQELVSRFTIEFSDGFTVSWVNRP
jgi:hypothetical protein